ncbi:hypothetical protein Sm713_78920 [Streptomyces sp. TS71-3]|nr:hypothetical protein Sm713_78920 [Streptomyces sp. TS71-3]
MELQALPSRIGQVRRIVSAQLRHWRLDALTDRAALGVTELLTNVHRHARPDKICTVDIELLLYRLTVSVRDHDPRLPRVHDAEPYQTCGRGLAMIAAMCENWGARAQGDAGKIVWFTLPVPGTAPLTATLPVYGAATTGPFTGSTDLMVPVDLAPGPGPLNGRAGTRSFVLG